MFDNKTFNDTCKSLDLDPKSGSELDWMMMCSKNQILFRDDRQRVRACDMDNDEFNDAIYNRYSTVPVQQYLYSQWRCKGGTDYINYLKAIFAGTASSFINIENYDFKLYTDVDNMYTDIRSLNDKYKLCRMAAGYAWEWATKKDKDAYDIFIDDYKYRWNSTYDNWIGSKNSVNEIGCIHTVQGYDLNYLGVIIGEDIKYDTEKNCIIPDISNYHDGLGKTGLTKDPEKLRDYLVNIYITLMTRGIRGTYVYVCDPALREYMLKFIPVVD